MVVAYHKVNQYANDVASLGRVDPILALWGPFVVFAVMIVWMYYRVAYVPGGQAIGWLDKVAETIGKKLKSLLRRRRSVASFIPVPANPN